MLIEKSYNPDVLSCLANLSSDEIFTPPSLVNTILDQLPASIWHDREARFLDPMTKSGVFLREIAKRLISGLENDFPDLQKRVDHIFTKQIFGIAITELTSLLARRSLYCSKVANGKYSACSEFKEAQGNIRFERIEHTWNDDGKCQFCGATEENYHRGDDLETHAYQFIHTNSPEEIFEMKFDVIVGNPPYQLSDGGFGRSASPIYHQFVKQAKKMEPRFLTMIIPARWYSGGKGLDDFRGEMLNDNRIREIHDFPDATDVFPGVQIKGGVCYFLWNRDSPGLCKVSSYQKGKLLSALERPMLLPEADTFVRYNEAISILDKVKAFNERSIKEIVSASKPFGFRTNFIAGTKPFPGGVVLHQNSSIGYVERAKIDSSLDVVDKYKVFIPPLGSGSDSFPHPILGRPFLGKPNSACTETYIYIGSFDSAEPALNLITYITTKFFRFLVLLNKPAQHATRKVYHFVPSQDLSKSWTDQELYQKYGLTDAEIAFIESLIQPMELEIE